MILQKWLEELRTAHGEQEVVAFARAKLERVQRDRLPEPIASHALASAEDVRTIAAMLAAVPQAASNDLLQQLLIVFSLATDRIAELERRGMLTRKVRAAVPPG
jgi:hypothetical protein